MLIICPNCNTTFEVPQNAFKNKYRTVKCSQCQHQWQASTPSQPSDSVPQQQKPNNNNSQKTLNQYLGNDANANFNSLQNFLEPNPPDSPNPTNTPNPRARKSYKIIPTIIIAIFIAIAILASSKNWMINQFPNLKPLYQIITPDPKYPQ